MPDAFENYATYQMHNRMLNDSPMTAGERDSMFTHDHLAMSTAGNYSPSSIESPVGMETETYTSEQIIDMINQSEITYRAELCPTPEIKIIAQPVDKFRFRYKSEMAGTHGSLLGEREGSLHKKEVPTVQLLNCPMKEAVIRCTLVTADEDRRFPHAHHLVRKDGNEDKDDPHDITVSDENNYTAMFCNMGIIHTAKKNIKEEIVRKKSIELIEEKKRKDLTNPNPIITSREDMEMKLEADQAQKWMNLNTVALCFQGFVYGSDNNVLHPVTEKVYSRAINNLKSALTGELKICRIDKHTSSCEGNEEVWLLVEKVGRKNIKVKFYELDDLDNITWEAEGRFSELDVHHQYAIVLRTPPYKDQNITVPKRVFLRLERPSDGETSNILQFHYKPSEKVMNRKRARVDSTSKSIEEKAQPANQLGSMPLSEAFVNLDVTNVSEELRKLIDEDPTGPYAKEIREFSGSSFLQEYISILQQEAQESDILSPGLVADGIADTSEREKAREDFARNTLLNIMKILKETGDDQNSKAEAIKKVQELLQETTYYGDTPLHFALRYEQFELAKHILTILAIDPSLKNIVNLQNSIGKTPLHLAVLQGKSDIVRGLLTLGADPNLCDEEDATALHNAVIAEAKSCIDELLKLGDKINLDLYTESGWSALHLAAKVGSLYAVRALVEAKADVNSTDMSYGRTALHLAVDGNHTHVVKYLLDKTNIDVNMKNFGGNTALHSAVVKGGKCAEELVKILKEHGADPQIRNNNISQEDTEEERSNTPSSERPSEPTTREIPRPRISDLMPPKVPSVWIPRMSGSTSAARSSKIVDQLSERFKEKLIARPEGGLIVETCKDVSMEERPPSKRPNVQLSDQARASTPMSIELLTSIKSETDSDLENFGESAFDLARDDPRLMRLLSSERPQDLMHEELDLKEEESDDDIALQQRAIMNIRSIVQKNFAMEEQTPPKPEPKKRGRKKKQPLDPQQEQQEQQLKRQQQLEQLSQGDKLSEVHIKRLIPILDRSSDWERLAQHMNQGSLVRLLKKSKSPSTALFRKIKLTHPNITVQQMKKFLIEVKSFEGATELENR